ncbi:phage major capsid protein, partial [Sinorhizobium meliloti]
MTIHKLPMTRQARALLAAGALLRKKDAGSADDVFERLSAKFGEHAGEVLRRLAEADEQMAGFSARILDMEQRAVRADFYGGSRSGGAETWGEQFTRHAGLKAFSEETTRPGRFRLEVKT